MSVNLHLAVVVRGYRTDRADAIRQTVRAVIEAEDLSDVLPVLAESQEAGACVLSARTDPQSPVIITGAYDWATRIQVALQEAVESANEGPCHVRFEWDDADAGRIAVGDDE